MPYVSTHSPQLEVRLYKTISRKADGQGLPASERYAGKSDYINLTPFLGDGSSVRTQKSVKAPAGGFSITIPDMPHAQGTALESVYGVVEPMDGIEIRMGHYQGLVTPVVMRGFVTNIERSQTMGSNGKPQRQVVISGQDYGKIWQMLQVLMLPRMLTGQSLLTNFKLFEMFGVGFENAMPAGDFIQQMVEKVVNKHLADMLPERFGLPREIKPDILVKHGTVSVHLDQSDGQSVFDIMRLHGDVGIWNELFTEDRQDGVYAVYRPTPALSLLAQNDGKSRKIQEDAPDPVYVSIPDSDIVSLSVGRSDQDVSNFYWVYGPKFSLNTDVYRLQYGMGSETVMINEYPNAAEKYYGPRAMYGSTQQGGDATKNHGSGLDAETEKKRRVEVSDWIDYRRKAMLEMNKDNVVLESGSMRVKGGPMRDDGLEPMKPGDYARLEQGSFTADYYVTDITHDFMPYRGYFSTLSFVRGEGFVERVRKGGGPRSPWLMEQQTV